MYTSYLSPWTVLCKRLWKSWYNKFPPVGTRYKNISKVIRHRALPFIWNFKTSIFLILYVQLIQSSQFLTSWQDHCLGSGKTKYRFEYTYRQQRERPWIDNVTECSRYCIVVIQYKQGKNCSIEAGQVGAEWKMGQNQRQV